MSENAEMGMALYQDLYPDEEKALKAVEDDVVKLLLEQGIDTRPFWTGINQGVDRYVSLCLPFDPEPRRVIFELLSSKLLILSQNELLSLFREGMEQLE